MKNLNQKKIYSLRPDLKMVIILSLLMGSFLSEAQDPHRFDKQVNELKSVEYDFNSEKKVALFTGSSSVRMWKDVQERFPEYNVINNGFGGSHFSDLIYFYDDLVKQFHPDVLFIYEGDNDIANNKRAGKIKREAKRLHKMIRADFPGTKIVFISPKPSVKRWGLKKQYERVNRKLERFSKRNNNTEFADVWTAMLDENGMVFRDIFLEDNLHMNKKGYDIWEEVVDDYLE